MLTVLICGLILIVLGIAAGYAIGWRAGRDYEAEVTTQYIRNLRARWRNL